MRNNTVGFIGTGNMGSALARAAAKAVPPEDLYLSNRTPEKAAQLAAQLGCRTADNGQIAANCDCIFLGVKPYMVRELVGGLQPVLTARQQRPLLVSMAAGIPVEEIREASGGCPVIRIMPNTPVGVGSGTVLYCAGSDVGREQMELFLQVMELAGALEPLAEELMDAATCVAGCGPAFAAMFLEALADGGVTCGLPRDKALKYAALMLRGTADLALETGLQPGQLKDAVCSPGGSTIAGVKALEEGGFRAAAMEAVIAAYDRTVAMKKESPSGACNGK